jgi:hypothetical protein
MTRSDPIQAAQEVKQATALLRDARAVRRKLDMLAATAMAINDPSLHDIAALRDACDRLVSRLAHREQSLHRRARDAVRRVR